MLPRTADSPRLAPRVSRSASNDFGLIGSADELRQVLLPKPGAIHAGPARGACRVFMAWSRRHYHDFVSIVLLFAVLFGGAAMFWAMMGYQTDSSDPQAWTYFNSVYFTAQILCTVGYGDFSPGDLPVVGQIFFPLFSYFALGVSWVALQVVPDFLDSVSRGFLKRYNLEEKVACLTPRLRLVMASVLMVGLCILGALGFSYLEDWSYGDAIYYTFVTVTTIGFGDFVPVTYHGRAFFIVFMFLMLGTFFWYFDSFADSVAQSAEADERLVASSHWLVRNRRWLVGVGVFLLYILLGAFVGFVAQGGAYVTWNPAVDPAPDTSNSTAAPWSYFRSVYQAVEVVTAVNYGDFVPVTPGGKAFVCIYAVLGVFVLSWSVAEVAKYMLANGYTVVVIRLRKGGAGVVRRTNTLRLRRRSTIAAYAPLAPGDDPAAALGLASTLPPPDVGVCCACGTPAMSRWRRFRTWTGTETGRTVVLALAYAAWCVLFGCIFVWVERASGNASFEYSSTIFIAFQAITTGGFGFPQPGEFPTTDVVRLLFIPYNIGGLFLLTAMLTAVGELAETLQAAVMVRIHAKRVTVDSDAAASVRQSY